MTNYLLPTLTKTDYVRQTGGPNVPQDAGLHLSPAFHPFPCRGRRQPQHQRLRQDRPQRPLVLHLYHCHRSRDWRCSRKHVSQQAIEALPELKVQMQ